MVGNCFERVAVAADDRPRIVERIFLRRVRGDIGVELRARQSFGKKPWPGRHGLRSDEWLLVVDQIEAAAIDFQIFAQQLRPCGLLLFASER